MKQYKVLIAIFAILTLICGRSVNANAQYINGSFIKGGNLAWENSAYNTWLGLDPTEPGWGVAYNSANLNSYMANLHSLGITVLRVWVNEGDMGDAINSSDEVTGVTSTWSTNFADMMRLAGNNGIQLYVTLNNGRADWLENPTQASYYLNNALIPLIKQYKGDSRIFAIDLMNEIDGTIAGSTGNYTTTGATWPEAQSYIKTFAAAIHSADSSRRVTCSSGWHSWDNLGYFKGLGLDFYDYHYYSDSPSIPTAASLGMDKPIYIGECGQASSTLSDTLQNSVWLSFANQASSEGYAGVGEWDYGWLGGTDVLGLINSDGSNRLVCSTIQNWHASGSGQLIANGTYKIINRLSGLALDAYNYGTGNGTVIDQWTYGGGNNQRWIVTNKGNNQYIIENVNAQSENEVLDAAGYGGSGTWTDLWASSGGQNQLWQATATSNGYYTLSPVYNTGLALDDYGGSTSNYNTTTNNGRIDVYTSTGASNQQWSFQSP